MATTASTNMNLPIPGVGTEAGPTWADDLNNCFTILDAHNHSSGSGVQITPSGMNINADLTFANNNLTNAKTLGMFVQTADPTTFGCLYYKGVDLYFNDGSSNHIRITASGSVSGASGTITGLPTGTASASYQAGSGTFVFQSATNTAANIDGQAFTLRNSSASSKGLTLSPPAAMGADIAMTFPSIPASTQAMTMTSGGAMGTITYDAIGQGMTATGSNAIASTRTRATGTSVAAGGVAISSSSGSFSSASTSFVDVTNLTVTIVTSGRPVFIGLIPDGTSTASNESFIGGSGISTRIAALAILNGASIIGAVQIYGPASSGSSSIFLPPGSLFTIQDTGAATITYKVQGKSESSGLVFANNCKLVAYEL